MQPWLDNHSHPLQGANRKLPSSKNTSLVQQEAISYNTERGSTVYVALLDVKKAFDTVWIAGLIYKLYNYKAGLDSTLFNIIINDYEQFECVVCTGGKLSSWFTPSKEFSKVTSCQWDCIHSRQTTCCTSYPRLDTCPTFADDVALAAPWIIFQTYVWHTAKKWHFIFSLIKSLSLIFGRDTDPATDIIIGIDIIRTVTFACHLEIPLTSKPTWTRRGWKNVYQSKMLLHYCRFSPALYVSATYHSLRQDSTQLSAYQSYCIVSRTPSQSQTIKLERALSQAGRHIQGLSQRASNHVSYQLLGWDSIWTMISMAKLL